MYFYPRTLKSQWYIADVCDSIASSLEGAKQWTKYRYESRIERDAYLEAFEECQKIVKENNLRPDAMLQALSDYHDFILIMLKPPFFSMARWFYKPNEAREQAVITAFDLVDGISKRYL